MELDNFKVDIKADLTPLSEALGSNLEKSPGWFDKICAVIFGRRYLNRIRDYALTGAQNQSDVQKILSGECYLDESGKLLQTPTRIMSLPEQISINSMKRESENTLSSLALAYREFNNDPTYSETETSDTISDTFTSWWKEGAKHASEPEFRKLWAHILVTEAKKPGYISFKLMDICRNLNQSDANLFDKISKAIINNAIIFMPEFSDNSFFHYSYEDLYYLNELGIVHADHFDQLELDSKNDEISLPYAKYMLILRIGSNSKIKFRRAFLTAAGKMLYELVATVTLENCKEFCRYLLHLKGCSLVQNIAILENVSIGDNTCESRELDIIARQ